MTERAPEQGELFPELVRPQEGETLEERFDAFHSANPHVYDRLLDEALDLVALGHTQCSAKMLVERVRWESMVRTTTREPYRINNSFTAFYARLLQQDVRLPQGFFELRRSVAGQESIPRRPRLGRRIRRGAALVADHARGHLERCHVPWEWTERQLEDFRLAVAWLERLLRADVLRRHYREELRRRQG